MKKIITIAFVFITSGNIYAQSVSINNTAQVADNSAILDVQSSEKGMLIPRMRTIERTAIVSPAQGLLVFDIDRNTFWYYAQSDWKEIPNTITGTMPTGPALGDLYGSYPSPNVGKIQNLDVAFGVPFDKQVMKWDMLNSKWQGQNDSLFLPYNSSFGSSAKLFGITNTNTSNGATAVYGKSTNAGSGITPSLTVGVWGDNSTGAGVMGTSSNNVGTYGYSVNNHGVSGFTAGINFAGVYGTRINSGPAVMGDIYSAGIGIYGKSRGTAGKAGVFANTNVANTDTTLKAVTAGTGTLGFYEVTNTNSANPVFDIINNGKGYGIKLRSNNNANAANVIDVFSAGTGDGINIFTTKGRAGVFKVTDPAAYSEALNVTTEGDARNVILASNNLSSFESNLFVEQKGLGKGIELNVTNTANANAGLSINTAGNRGADIISAGSVGIAVSASGNNPVAVYANTGQTANNANAIRGLTGVNVSNGTGVYGEAGSNDNSGIGVKGISYSTQTDRGAVTAVNKSSGYAVYGESTGNDGVGIYGIAGNNASNTKAAIFKNINAANVRNVVEVSNNGTGSNMFVNNTNAANNSPVLRIRNNSTGNFLLLEDGGAGSVTSFAKNGNITTDGTLTVKSNKGIVRNSSATQLRIEVVQATFTSAAGETLTPNQSRVVTVTFASPFSSAPTVYIGNMIADGNSIFMNTAIKDVTATDCKLHIVNATSSNIALFTSSWKIVAMGAE
ncbi:MAG: H-type lectin domain-containing protein [Ferruginibacter sp.]